MILWSKVEVSKKQTKLRSGVAQRPLDRDNIFWRHYYKHQGGHLWKDLAGETHKERISSLEKYVAHNMQMYFNATPKKDYAFCLRGAKFFCRLLSFVYKNPDIPAQQ